MIRRLLLACLLISPAAAAADERPNIVFFLADDQTSSSLGCYGHAIAKTPHIDALAAQGVRFKNSFVSQSIWTRQPTR